MTSSLVTFALLLTLGDAAALSVPYVPQTEALCGGAAATMVLRYWGDTRAGVQQFEPLVDRRAGGIATDALVEAIERRGWRARQLPASIDVLRGELRAGRPVVLLLQDRASRYHYVVAIGADDTGVVVHDPSWGPSRRLAIDDFVRRWEAARFWSLVIVPLELPNGRRVRLQADPGRLEANEGPRDACDRLLADAVDDLHQHGLARADAVLGAVRDRCPESAGPLRELAGVRFAERRWREAEALAQRALARDAVDAYAWDVLGASRFMQDDATGALQAWNRIGRPRVDTIRIEGLSRSRYALVAEALALPSGSLLTADTLKRAERRLELLPNQSGARIGYRPQADGSAGIDVAIAERRARPHGAVEWIASAARAGVDREIAVAVPGPTGQGEMWDASWRWWAGRPRVALSFSTPHAGSLPGLWRVEGSWDAQTYGVGAAEVRETRAHGGVGVTDWMTAAWRYELRAGLDSWNDTKRAVSFGGSLERRLLSDRVSVLADGEVWTPLTSGDSYGTAGLRATFRSTPGRAHVVYAAIAGIELAGAAAPLALWPGGGEGRAREPLVRAHPLLSDGIVRGPMFGRRLAYANQEVQRWFDKPILPRLGVAAFADLASVGSALDLEAPLSEARMSAHLDIGVGLRVKMPGQRRVLRVDLARGVRDGARALTVGWQF